MKMRYVFFLLTILLPVLKVQAQVPKTIAYQGYLTDADGVPLNGTVNLAFRLYDAPTGGSASWAESQVSVPVSNGVIAVQLGRAESLSDVVFDRPLWLGVRVNGGNELTPRVALEAAPYALSVRGLRVVPAEDENNGPSLLGGDVSNTVVEGSDGATVSGGRDNQAGRGATVGGGRDNQALDCYDTVAGGLDNRAAGFGGGRKTGGARCGATVGGGADNTANNESATVAGGWRNTASGSNATVGGGGSNVASGSYATVPGGWYNQARGRSSFAAGYYARAIHDGSFVWSDNAGSNADSLVTTAENQFLIRASGGVGIGTNTPQGALHVTEPGDGIDLVLGGTGDTLFGDDGVIASDPDLPSSDIWLRSNNSVALMLDADDSQEDSGFLVVNEGLDALLQVDQDGTTSTERLEVQSDLEAGTAPAEGGVYRDNVVYAWAHVNGDGSVTSSFGCTVTRIGTGTYRISYQRSLNNGAAPVVTPLSANDPVFPTVASSSNTQATVKTWAFFNGGFQGQDRTFFIQVVGRP